MFLKKYMKTINIYNFIVNNILWLKRKYYYSNKFIFKTKKIINLIKV
jgi:hypothetical protein